MAQRAASVEVLRMLISIGPRTMHFQTWSDGAGAAVSAPLAPLTDPTNGFTFPDLNAPPFAEDIHDQLDHARAMSVLEPEPSEMFGDSSDRDPRRSDGSAPAHVHLLSGCPCRTPTEPA
jgi:hypothetical protein